MSEMNVEFTGAEGNVLRGVARGANRPRQTVLFMHGGGQTLHSWAGAAKTVAEHYRTIVMDARGHGSSDWPDSGDYRLSALAADLLNVCQALTAEDGRSPVVVGASMGGLAAMLAGRDDENLYAGLVLVDITPRMEQTGVDRILEFMAKHTSAGFATVEDAGAAIAAYRSGSSASRSLTGLAKNLRKAEDGRLYWHWDPRFVEGPLPIESNVPSQANAVEEGLLNLTCPIALIRGSRSDLVSPEAVIAFRKAVPHADYIDVSGAGHMVVGDRNDVFTAAVLSFIQREISATT